MSSSKSYRVSQVLRQRIQRGKREYFVEWQGKNPKQCTWEPVQLLGGCIQYTIRAAKREVSTLVCNSCKIRVKQMLEEDEELIDRKAAERYKRKRASSEDSENEERREGNNEQHVGRSSEVSQEKEKVVKVKRDPKKKIKPNQSLGESKLKGSEEVDPNIRTANKPKQGSKNASIRISDPKDNIKLPESKDKEELSEQKATSKLQDNSELFIPEAIEISSSDSQHPVAQRPQTAVPDVSVLPASIPIENLPSIRENLPLNKSQQVPDEAPANPHLSIVGSVEQVTVIKQKAQNKPLQRLENHFKQDEVQEQQEGPDMKLKKPEVEHSADKPEKDEKPEHQMNQHVNQAEQAEHKPNEGSKDEEDQKQLMQKLAAALERENLSGDTECSTVYIKNLPYSCQEASIRTIFKVFGQISSVQLPVDQDKNPRGFAFVSFKERVAAAKAIRLMDKTKIGGRVVYLQFSKK